MKMGWKNWPYWLKEGVRVIIIVVIVIFLLTSTRGIRDLWYLIEILIFCVLIYYFIKVISETNLKNWPYWLKWGFWGIIVVIFMLIYLLRGYGLFAKFQAELLFWIFIGLLFSFSICLLQKIKSKCWLRAGVIGVLIGTIILILSYIGLYYTQPIVYGPMSVLWKYPLFVLIFKIIPAYSFGDFEIIICGIMSFLINTFIIGTLTGWIYGKIKSKSKKK